MVETTQIDEQKLRALLPTKDQAESVPVPVNVEVTEELIITTAETCRIKSNAPQNCVMHAALEPWLKENVFFDMGGGAVDYHYQVPNTELLQESWIDRITVQISHSYAVRDFISAYDHWRFKHGNTEMPKPGRFTFMVPSALVKNENERAD